MKQIQVIGVISIFLLTMFQPCTIPAAPVKPATGPSSKADGPVAGKQPAGQGEWERTLQAARTEGKVVMYTTSWGPQIRKALTEALKEKFGITLEFMPFSRGADLTARVQQEKTAGAGGADIFGAGGGTLISIFKPQGLMGNLEPLLHFPEVTDARSWRGGKMPFLDRDKQIIIMAAGAQRYIMYNTELIPQGEIATYRDVLKPQYKGKITLNDPTVTGAGNAFMGHLGLHLWNAGEAKEYLKQLIKQQEAVIQRDNRLHVEAVARGKFAIGLAPNEDNAANFFKSGAPIAMVYPKEGVYVAPGAGCIAVPVKSPHPNATAVFINWLLTREGQTIYSRSRGTPSMRLDVSTEGINPVFIAQPGEKLYLPTEESFEFWGKMLTIAKEAVQETAPGR